MTLLTPSTVKMPSIALPLVGDTAVCSKLPGAVGASTVTVPAPFAPSMVRPLAALLVTLTCS